MKMFFFYIDFSKVILGFLLQDKCMKLSELNTFKQQRRYLQHYLSENCIKGTVIFMWLVTGIMFTDPYFLVQELR